VPQDAVTSHIFHEGGKRRAAPRQTIGSPVPI
jgi:hypothetical protein